MRLSLSPLLLSFFLISFSFTGALVAAQALPVDSVWIMRDGATDGGCDANGRIAILNRWQSESWDLASNAYNYIVQYSSDKYVRRACSTFFGLKSTGRGTIQPSNKRMLRDVTAIEVFSRLQSHFGTTSQRAKAGLFCGSDWLKLVDGGVDAAARDIMGDEIWIDNKPRTISNVYNEYIGPNDVPYWSENPRGYEFEVEGEFCSDNPTTKAATSGLKAVSPSGVDDLDDRFGVTLCPLSFDCIDALDTLPAVPAGGNVVIPVGVDGKRFKVGTGLNDTLPKSATLFHEALHFLYVDGLSAGNEEKYSLSECTNTKWPSRDKRRNPENYVFFAAAMWYRQHGFDFSSGKMVFLT